MNGLLVGYLCCFVSVLGFGTSYIPVKKVDTKDGVFYSFCLSMGVLLVGIVQWAAFGFYKFVPFAMLGGVIWAIGNACVPFIINRCGLGTGQLVWSVTNMLTGWATGTFGLFGKDKDTVEYVGMNCAGVTVVVASLAAFALREKESDTSDARTPELAQSLADVGGEGPAAEGERSAASEKFLAGFLVALVAGVFMGSNFDPSTYLMQIGPPDYSSDAMDYVFSQFVGIFLASAAYFLAYRVARGGNSYNPREVAMPGMLSGLIWAVAQVGWFKANVELEYVVTFPIVVGIPGLLASISGVVLFGENNSRRNLSVLALVIVLQAFGVILIAVSKGDA